MEKLTVNSSNNHLLEDPNIYLKSFKRQQKYDLKQQLENLIGEQNFRYTLEEVNIIIGLFVSILVLAYFIF